MARGRNADVMLPFMRRFFPLKFFQTKTKQNQPFLRVVPEWIILRIIFKGLHQPEISEMFDRLL